MPRFAVNLSLLFTDVPLLRRFERAARAGFRSVEFMFPYGEDVDGIERELKRLGLELILFNLPAGDFAAGERGLANHPARRGEFRDGVAKSIEIARRLRVPRVNGLVGVRLRDVPEAEQHACLVDNLRHAATELEKAGLRFQVEPLNDTDTPGFYLTTSRQAFRLMDDVGHPNIALQYDVYHMQIMEGNLTTTIINNLQRIPHIQIADVPGRHQPGTGEINFPFLLRRLDEIGYQGYVSLEYRPEGTPEESFGWLKEMGFW
ncbi:MAG: hydroxypyruvate isomerase family protein [Armatimonadetes bacterium]|nr:hydroxypyruvate isomerase family protein [Armatimonadota bacterium]